MRFSPSLKVAVVGKRIIIGIIVAVLIGSFSSNLFRSTHNQSDFSAIRRASEHVLSSGRLSDSESLGYYPPSARIFLLPFAFLPLPAAMSIWWLISVFFYCACFYMVFKYILPDNISNKFEIFAITFLLLTPWLVSDLNAGNLSSFILFVVVGSYALHLRGYPIFSGLLLGLGIVVKLIPIFLLIWYIVRRKWQAALASGVSVVLLSIIPGLLVFGYRDFSQSWRVWLDSAVKIRTAEYTILDSSRAPYSNQSWTNNFIRILHHVSSGRHDKPFYVNFVNLPRRTILKLWYLFAAISGAIWIYMIYPRKDDSETVEKFAFALVCPIMIWFSPHVFSYYLTMLLPAIAVFVWGLSSVDGVMAGIKTRLFILLAILVAGCFSPASLYLRAFGAYQFVVLITMVAVFGVISQLRRISVRDNSTRARMDRESPQTVVPGDSSC